MFIKYTLAVCRAFALLALLLVVAIFVPTFSMDFYRAEYAKQDTARRIGVSEDQLMAVTKRLTDYMRGRVDDLVITVDVNGVPREFFNDLEKAHMVDVKDLFTVARVAVVLAVAVLLVTSALLRKDRRLEQRVGLGVVLGFVLLLLVLAGVIALDFERAFTTFHLLFFNNDLWILDPATCLLVNIVPLAFFIDIAVRVGLIFGGLALAYCAAAAASLYFLRRKS